MTATELGPDEFSTVLTRNGPEIDLPDWLPLDEAKCSVCETGVGYVYTVEEDSHGNEREGYVWAETWRTEDGRLLCGSCEDES